MGLGKTLQGIALIWTLLTAGHPALGGAPLARRAIIVCPTSLVGNWDAECVKWLGGALKTLPLCEASRDEVVLALKAFLGPRPPAPLLIVSYETFRLHAERFAGPDACDILVCDEAHRLKNDATLTNRALDSLACRRRVLLSGAFAARARVCGRRARAAHSLSPSLTLPRPRFAPWFSP
jgi:DNA repair and recombination RAD54-like protein